MWGNLSLEVVFVAGGRKIYEKKPLGRGYNLAIAKKAREKKKISEPLNTLGRIIDSGVLLSGFYLRRKKKENLKNSTFFAFYLRQTGV
jgi:hypothetical protein